MKQYVTISDIAQKAGVGKGTVDRVLHNRGRIAEETRLKVLRCIDELGYQPNRAARILAKNKVYRIAVIYHNKEVDFWKQVQRGIEKAEEEYRQLGVVVDKFILPKIDIEGQLRILEKVIADRYDGIAVVPYHSQKIVEKINQAVESGIKVVTFNNDEECKRFCYIGQELKQSGRTAGKLMSLIAPINSRYIVVVPIIDQMSALYSRYEGFQEVLSQKRKDMVLANIFNFEQDGEQAYATLSQYLRKNEIDAIYVSNVILEDVAKAVNDAGLDEKILLVGHDLTDAICEYIKKGTIDFAIGQEPEQQGYLAVEKICRNLLMDEDISGDIYTKIEVVTAENVDYS